jgi:hypothetical protein
MSEEMARRIEEDCMLDGDDDNEEDVVEEWLLILFKMLFSRYGFYSSRDNFELMILQLSVIKQKECQM